MPTVLSRSLGRTWLGHRLWHRGLPYRKLDSDHLYLSTPTNAMCILEVLVERRLVEPQFVLVAKTTQKFIKLRDIFNTSYF